ncbi:MAG: hypothetical protein R3C54_14980 [Parvularculaceae bacterium]
MFPMRGHKFLSEPHSRCASFTKQHLDFDNAVEPASRHRRAAVRRAADGIRHPDHGRLDYGDSFLRPSQQGLPRNLVSALAYREIREIDLQDSKN